MQKLDCDERSLVIVDTDDRVVLALGAEDRPTILKTIADHRWLADIRRRRLMSMEVGGETYIALATPVADHLSLLFLPVKHEEALLEFISTVDFSFDILDRLLTNPFDSMTMVDAEGNIVFISRVHENFFGLAPGEAIGKHVTEVIDNTRLHIVAQTGKAEVGQVQEMRGHTRVVARVPIMRDGHIVGAIGRVMFKGPDQLHLMSQELHKLKNEVEYYKREASSLRNRTYGLDDIVGTSDAVRQLKDDMVRVATLDVPVLLIGESGTGKELVAQSLHRLSPRRDHAMVMVNAAALPAGLVESELFGYEAGAFTGAQRKGHRGKFEAADKSTLFLDEIGDMPMEVQVKLLRVLQDGTFERVGGNQILRSCFRLISATNRDLTQMIDQERFRLDLYYRISGVTLRMPALKDRLQDIPALVQHFITAFADRHGSSVNRVHSTVYDYLKELPWPGNLRQLNHEIERALIFCNGPELTVEAFRPSGLGHPPSPPTPITVPKGSLKDTLERVELDAIAEALVRHGGNKKKVAEELEISRSYLYKRLGEIEASS